MPGYDIYLMHMAASDSPITAAFMALSFSSLSKRTKVMAATGNRQWIIYICSCISLFKTLRMLLLTICLGVCVENGQLGQMSVQLFV